MSEIDLLSTEQENTEGIDILGTSPPQRVDPDLANRRAVKAHFALGSISPGVDVLQSDFVQGYEDQTRQKMMSIERAKHDESRQKKIMDYVEQARRTGRVLDTEDMNHINSLASDVDLNNFISNPNTYFEKKYARAMINVALDEMNNKDIPEETRRNPLVDSLEKHIAKSAMFHRLSEEYNSKLGQQSLISKTGDFLETLIPFKSWWNQTDVVKNAPTSSFLNGNNIEEQIQYLYDLGSVDQAEIEARRALDDIYSRNGFDAAQFASFLSSYTENDKLLQNLFASVDVAGSAVIPGVRGGVNTLKAIARSGGSASTTIPGVLDATGNTARAAFSKVQTNLKNISDEASGSRPGSFTDLLNETTAIQNPSSILRDVGTTPFSREFADRLTDTLTNQASGMLKGTVLDPVNVTRIEPGTDAYRQAMAETYRLFTVQYPQVNDAIQAVRPIRSIDNVLGNTDHIAVQLGRKTGELFDEAYEAQAVAKLWGLKDARVVQRGEKFYIEVTKAVDETLPSVRNALAQDTLANPTPNTFLGRFMGYFRTRDNIVSTDITRETKNATFGAEQLSALSQAIMSRAFENLPRWRSSSRQDFMSFITMQRDTPRVPTLQRGHFSETIGEFVNDWRNHHGRLPTEQETTAYFTYKQVNDMEYTLRNLNIYKGKTRLGLEDWEFKVNKEQTTQKIEGRLVDSDRMYAPQDDAGIFVIDPSGANGHVYVRKNYMTQADRGHIQWFLDEGFKIVQISHFGEDALRRSGIQNLPTGRINYVISKNHSSSPLSAQQIPYRAGGHVEYADSFFVSQAKVTGHDYRGTRIHDYYGDTTIHSARTLEEARNTARLMEGGRLLLGDSQALRQYLARNNMPYSLQEFTRLFDAQRGGILDPNTPILARAKGSTLAKEHKLDSQYINFRDPADSLHNLLNEDVNLKYAMDRNEQLDRMLNIGSDLAPIYGLSPGRLLDPAATLARSASTIARGKYLEDLKIKSAERFVAEFGYLLTDDAKELIKYPQRLLDSAVFNKSHPDKAELARAMNYQRSMKEFLSIKDPTVARSETILTVLANTIRNAPLGGGARAETFLDTWTDSWLARRIDDPVKFFRQVAFYSKMGFFNPKQLFLQASGVVHAAALEGLPRALQGFGSGALMRPLHLSNGSTHLEHAAKLALQHGYRTTDHFKESYLALQRTGFQNVGGEYGNLDDFLSPTPFNVGSKKALDDSLMFFKKGERVNRLTAWNAAYLSWRDANPLLKFDDTAVKQVLNRADLITMNMTRASNASWNQGLASIPTQFWSYQARMMDQILGANLNWQERRRIWLTYSALYGVPSGVLGTTAGVLWPFHEETRKQMIARGVDLSDPVYKAFVDGIPQTIASAITGGEGPNLSETFGPNGLSFLKDLITEEGSVAEALGGPSIKTSLQIFEGVTDLVKAGFLQSEPMVSAIMSTGLSNDGQHYRVRDLEIKDALEKMLKPISTVSNSQKAFYAINANTYFTKNGDKLVTDQNGWQAFFTGLLGTNPQEISDFYSKIEIKKGIEDFQRQPRSEAIKWLRRSYDPAISIDDMYDFQRKAATFRILGNFTDKQWHSILKESTRNHTTQIEEMDKKLRNADTNQYDRWMRKLRGEE